jgi:hypothetical protein
MTVEEREVVVVKEFAVLWKGWECDSVGYLVLDEGKYKIVLTDHGRPYFAKPIVLEQKLKEYRSILSDTKNALRTVYSNKLEGVSPNER